MTTATRESSCFTCRNTDPDKGKIGEMHCTATGRIIGAIPEDCPHFEDRRERGEAGS